jgi:hypothetical protein
LSTEQSVEKLRVDGCAGFRIYNPALNGLASEHQYDLRLAYR